MKRDYLERNSPSLRKFSVRLKFLSIPDSRGKLQQPNESKESANQPLGTRTQRVKFIYSEKATKFCKIFTLLLTAVHTVKSKGEISQNVVAFSEYMNFNNDFTLFFRFPFPLEGSSRQIFVGNQLLKQIYCLSARLERGTYLIV